ncbi:MAG: hypothetical protein WC410_03545 [Candidatus Paceibacterota bacterium]|jgi:hypothetical protein|nr:hypothetical protein [Candidatus Paceibacterota bacterium]MDD5555121.1 hypothetical protein [Candidatus Paceibacterota bacterium]
MPYNTFIMTALNKIKLSFASLTGLFFASVAQAVCPVCIAGVTAGVGLARWLKIDDTITGLWIGGLTVALITWTIDWLNKRNISFPARNLLIIIAYYALVIWPLRSIEVIGHQYHKIWGMDKLILTIFIGSIAFYLFEKWYRVSREKRGKSLFRYQKVVWPLIPLTVLSIVFYFLTR